MHSRVWWVFNPWDKTRTSPKQNIPDMQQYIMSSAPSVFLYIWMSAVCTALLAQAGVDFTVRCSFIYFHSLFFVHNSWMWPKVTRGELKHIETNESLGASFNLACRLFRRWHGYVLACGLGAESHTSSSWLFAGLSLASFTHLWRFPLCVSSSWMKTETSRISYF